MKIFKNHKYSVLAKILKYSFVFIIVLSIFTSYSFVNAEVSTGKKIEVKIENPLGHGIDDLPKLIAAILDIVLVIGIPIITLAIIYAGFLFVQAQGNPEAIKKAKATLLYTIIGAALLLGAWVIANAIKGTVDEIKRTAYYI
jgi:hypothetical protein